MTPNGYRLHYDATHPPTDAHAKARCEAHVEQLRPLLPPPPGRVLDVGCATGHALLALKALGFESAIGIDIDPGVVELAMARGLDARHVPDPMLYFQTHKEHFTAALLLDVLEHQSPDAQVDLLSGIRQALEPGGRLIVTVPNAATPASHYALRLDHTHVGDFSEQSLSYALRLGGFDRFEFRGVRGSGPLPLGFRSLTRSGRSQLMRWTVQRLWLSYVRSEIGDWHDIDSMLLDMNLTVVAYR